MTIQGRCSRSPRSRPIVGSAVAMIVWSRAARSIASRTPRMIVRISAVAQAAPVRGDRDRCWSIGFPIAAGRGAVRARGEIAPAARRRAVCGRAPRSRALSLRHVPPLSGPPAGKAAMRVRLRMIVAARWLFLVQCLAPRTRLTLAQARRIALAAQGFAEPPPGAADGAPSRPRAAAQPPAPDRFGQRAGAGPLHAAVLAARRLRPGPARGGRLSAAQRAASSNTGATRPP